VEAYKEPKTEIVVFRTTTEMKQKLTFISKKQKNTITGAIEVLIDKEYHRLKTDEPKKD